MRPKDLVPFLKIMHRAKEPVCVLGAPGVGKSDIFKQVARELGIGFIDFRLIYFDPVDLRGIPMPNEKQGTTKWLTPDFFPKDGEGLLLMEELTSAPTAVQAAAYQLTLDRQLGEYKLPDGWSVMAAGNRQSDRAVANRMPSALVSRMNIQTLEPSLDDWLEYATRQKKLGNIKEDVDSIIPEICAFVRLRPEKLNDFNPEKWKDNAPFACPRTWEKLSDVMQIAGGKLTLEMMAGSIGEGAAAEFFGFLDIYRKVPSIEAILLNPSKCEVPKDAAPLYAVTTALARRATEDNADRVFTYLSRMPKEFEVCCVKDMSNRNKEITNIKAFNDWLNRNTEIFS